MQEVCANINNAYNTYMNVDRFSRKFSRTLIGRSIKALFDVTQNYWDQVAKIEDLLWAELKRKYLLVVLQNHFHQKQFITNHFKLDLEVVAVETFFILTERVDPSKIRVLKQQIEVLDKGRGSMVEVQNKSKEFKEDLKEFYNKFK